LDGVFGADATVGPSLERSFERTFIAGRLAAHTGDRVAALHPYAESASALHAAHARTRAERRARSVLPRHPQHALEDAPRGCDLFKNKEDGCLRAVFAP
jgi:hypothetical protein